MHIIDAFIIMKKSHVSRPETCPPHGPSSGPSPGPWALGPPLGSGGALRGSGPAGPWALVGPCGDRALRGPGPWWGPAGIGPWWGPNKYIKTHILNAQRH